MEEYSFLHEIPKRRNLQNQNHLQRNGKNAIKKRCPSPVTIVQTMTGTEGGFKGRGVGIFEWNGGMLAWGKTKRTLQQN